MIRFVIRLAVRIVMLLVLAAAALVVYHLYETNQFPGLRRVVENTSVEGAVTASLKIHKTLSNRPIEVDSEAGVVTLGGRVATEAEQAEALALVAGVEGVEAVVDRLEIDPSLVDTGSPEPKRSLGQRFDDVALLAKLRAALHLDKDTRGVELDLSVSSGTVVVGGEVRTAALADHVLSRVKSVSGVEAVESRLEILEVETP